MKGFFKEAGQYLKPNGCMYTIYSSIANIEEIIDVAEKCSWKCKNEKMVSIC